MIFGLFSIFMNIVALIILLSVVISLIHGAPPVPTNTKTLARMLKFSNGRTGIKAVDLGSGDGRLVIALAKEGIESHGYEINPFLVLLTKYHIRKAGLQDRAFVYWKNFWGVDLAAFELVTVYGMPHIMGDLQKKLQKELRTDSKVISNSFPFPDWEPLQKEENVYVYVKT